MTLDRGDLTAALAAATKRLHAAGIETAAREARLLLAHALDADVVVTLGHGERRLTEVECGRLRMIVDRRARREPLAHIVGRREFWSLPLEVCADVLTPRPESETLVEAALDARADAGTARHVLDLGTGSGCLLLALLHEWPGAWGVGVDRSPRAVTIARRNAVCLGLGARAAFIVGDWAHAVHGHFDIVVANPPYVTSAQLPLLAPEVTNYEPALALDGGADGLAAFRDIAPQILHRLTPTGVAIVEIGEGQADDVAAIFIAVGLRVGDRRRDLSGIERCLVLHHMTARNS